MDNALKLLLVWLGAVSLLTLLLFGWDKLMAKANRRRVPEATLWAAAILGGGVGGFAGMKLFRHKTKKGFFPLGLPLLAVVQLGLLVWAAIR